MINASVRAALAAALLAGIAHPAWADGGQPADPRLVERLYAADQVVRVEGKPNVQATIRFADNEQIENVAIGDSQAWQVTPNKRANLLFVKPLAARAATNMTVVTDRRTYLFDLVASPAARNPLYVLAFTYPEEDLPPVAEQAILDGPTPVELAAAADPLAVTDPSQLNFEWASKGAAKLFPSRAYDNGEATFLTWSPGTPLPAILVRDHKGTEGPVNFAVRGEVIVVDGVPREIVLRSGEDMATLTNQGPVRPSRPATDHATALARPRDQETM